MTQQPVNQEALSAEELAEDAVSKFNSWYIQKPEATKLLAYKKLQQLITQAQAPLQQALEKAEMEIEQLKNPIYQGILQSVIVGDIERESKARISDLEGKLALIRKYLEQIEKTQDDELHTLCNTNELALKAAAQWYTCISLSSLALTQITKEDITSYKQRIEADVIQRVLKIINEETTSDPEWGFETDVETVLERIQSLLPTNNDKGGVV